MNILDSFLLEVRADAGYRAAVDGDTSLPIYLDTIEDFFERLKRSHKTHAVALFDSVVGAVSRRDLSITHRLFAVRNLMVVVLPAFTQDADKPTARLQ
jgi:hypothetical protein